MTDIEKAQHLLAYLDYYNSTCDGIWGPLSKEACRSFQEDYFLTPDGEVDTETHKMLIGVISGTVAKREKNNDYWKRIRWFKRSDPYIACPCPRCGGFPVEPAETLMVEADLMRETLGHPMVPSSTVRCQAHNDELPGSASNSYHVTGHAMDFGIPGVPDATIIAYLNKRKAAGAISYWYQMAGGNFHFQVPK